MVGTLPSSGEGNGAFTLVYRGCSGEGSRAAVLPVECGGSSGSDVTDRTNGFRWASMAQVCQEQNRHGALRQWPWSAYRLSFVGLGAAAHSAARVDAGLLLLAGTPGP